jgi:MFS family permease
MAVTLSPQASDTGPRASARGANYTLAVLTITWFIAYLDRKLISLLVPALKRDLVLTDVQASLLEGVAFAVLFVVAGLPIGRLVDRYNRRNIVIAGVLCWSASTILCGFARSYEQLFITRMFVGLGEACLAPAAASIATDLFASARRGRAMGVMLMGGAVGTGASALLAGAITHHFANGATGLFSGFATWQLTFIAAGAPGVLVALLLLTAKEPARHQAAGATSQPGLVAILKERWRFLVPLYVAFVANMVASFGTGAWIPTMLMRDYTMSLAQVGYILGSLLLGMGVISPVLGGWASDFAARRDPISGRLRLVSTLFAAQLALGAAIFLAPGLNATLVCLAFNSLISSCLAASALVVFQESAEAQIRGQVMAIYLVLTNVVGMGLGPLFVALLTDHVFANETMVRASVATALSVTGAIGFAMIAIASPMFRTARREGAQVA